MKNDALYGPPKEMFTNKRSEVEIKKIEEKREEEIATKFVGTERRRDRWIKKIEGAKEWEVDKERGEEIVTKFGLMIEGRSKCGLQNFGFFSTKA